jgi:hypothetical protein
MPRWKMSSARQRVLGGFVLCLFFCSCLVPNPALAQPARALVLLGKFAVGVATTAAATLLSNRVEAYLDPGQKTPAKTPPTPPSAPPTPVGYRFAVQWRMPGGLYNGTLMIRSGEGTFRVAAPGGLVVDQDITARSDGTDVWLVGSNPRAAFSPSRATGYLADAFRIVKNAEGEWKFADVCDVNGCAPVYVTEASTF